MDLTGLADATTLIRGGGDGLCIVHLIVANSARKQTGEPLNMCSLYLSLSHAPLARLTHAFWSKYGIRVMLT